MTKTTFPVFDGHNDTLLNLYNDERGQGRSFFERSEIGHIDLPRAKEGGFAGGFFAIFIPGTGSMPDFDAHRNEHGYDLPIPDAVDTAYAQREAQAMSDLLHHLARESDGQLVVTRTVDAIESCLHNDQLAAILHFEGAEPIDPALDTLQNYYDNGLRSLGLVWSRPNAFAHGVPLRFPSSPDTGPGLTDAGKALVKACNQLGIMIDLSHLNEAGFWDVAKLSDAPLVATHSNVHAISPSARNLTDKQLDAIKESDGMVGLNFAVIFLREDGQWEGDAPLETMVRHIDYLVERIGIDRVGFGSDFDGAKIPDAIGDVAGLPKLIDALRSAGYDDEALRKITHENWLRVLRKTWR
ncbi:MAG: membrane dipeptidase [Chloroflexi bacterium]|nr:MAG: membrane dipeptidase [Chloroflexota bacterium]